MKNTKKILMTISLFMLNSHQAISMPSAYVSKHGSLLINNSTNSTLLRDTDKSQTVWVLPPTSGKTEFRGLVPSSNLGFCSGISALIKASNSIDARIGKLADKQTELLPDLIDAEKDLKTALEEKGEVANDPIIKEMVMLQNEIILLEGQEQDYIDQLENCNSSCDAITSSLNEVSMHLHEQRIYLRDLQKEQRDATRQLQRVEAKVEAAEQVYQLIQQRYDFLTLKLAGLSNQLLDLYAQKGKLEGGTALIDYNTGWDDNIISLEKNYPQYDFKAIPTNNARIHANIVGAADKESYYESLPAILDYSIEGIAYIPWGTNQHEQTSLPSTLSGNVRLTTLGACPIAFKNFFQDTGFEPERDNLTNPKFSISVTYKYPVSYNFNVKASYNLYKVYEEIKKGGGKSGFFSTKSYSEVLQNEPAKDTFSIEWSVEDPESNLSEEKKRKITAEIKKDLINRVLTSVSQPIPNTQGVQNFSDPGMNIEPGSIVAARTLSNTCGFNLYCQASAWILKGAQASFGSKQTEKRYKKEWNKTATESWSENIIKYRDGSTSFKR
ncbi:MAG: hypothetical protein R3B45_06775 [Bdellovibrionota bacterium]